MSFFLLGANERIGKTNRLMKLFKLVNWDRVDKYLSSLRKNALYSLGGNQLSMFKAILLSQWYNLSDMVGLMESCTEQEKTIRSDLLRRNLTD